MFRSFETKLLECLACSTTPYPEELMVLISVGQLLQDTALKPSRRPDGIENGAFHPRVHPADCIESDCLIPSCIRFDCLMGGNDNDSDDDDDDDDNKCINNDDEDCHDRQLFIMLLLLMTMLVVMVTGS